MIATQLGPVSNLLGPVFAQHPGRGRPSLLFPPCESDCQTWGRAVPGWDMWENSGDTFRANNPTSSSFPATNTYIQVLVLPLHQTSAKTNLKISVIVGGQRVNHKRVFMPSQAKRLVLQ